MIRNAKNYEAHLNELLSDVYSENEAMERYAHLNNGNIRPRTIVEAHKKHELGTLVRKHDPIGFNAGLSEWSKG